MGINRTRPGFSVGRQVRDRFYRPSGAGCIVIVVDPWLAPMGFILATLRGWGVFASGPEKV
jgi:hypothetical protein